MRAPTFIRNWDDDQKASAVKILGLVVAAFSIFTLLATISYLFNWKADMSILTEADPSDVSVQAENASGKLGFRFGRLLVCKCFGLGSFAFLVILVAISARLLLKRWNHSLVKTALMALTGAAIASFLLAYIGGFTGAYHVFGGGLGGICGAYAVNWALNLFGPILTGIFILILILAWMFFSSRRFTRWFSQLGTGERKHRVKKEKKGKNAEESEQKEVEDWIDLAEPEEQETTVGDIPVSAFDDTSEGANIDLVPEMDIDSAEVQALTRKSEDTVSEDPVQSLEIVEDDTLDARIIEPLPRIDNRLDPPDGLPQYKFPGLDLLEDHSTGRRDVSNEELMRNNNKIRAALANYKIQVVDVKAIVGPTVTLYKVYPAPGVKISEIKKLQEDIAMSLNAKGVRVVTLSDSVGIEVANDYSSIVPLKKLMNDGAFRESKAELPVAIGYTITQKVKVFDLADAPHLLIAGATKQGKSVGLNVIVSSLLYSKHPSELKFVFIDPKMVEFSAYNELLKHYLAVLPEAASEDDERSHAIVKNPKDAEKILRSLCIEMDDRYKLLSEAGVNKISLYNDKYQDRHLNPKNGHRYLPYLVAVVDEYADLTMTVGASPEAKAASRSITNSIIRLAQKGRAAGIHVILATQRPSVDVISGLIKSNFPMRIAFRVASRVDSMTILDAPGAEKLIGKGDMLFSAGIDTERIQCGYVSGDEIDGITNFIGAQQGFGKCYNTPYYLPMPEDPNADNGGMVNMKDLDERFEEAAEMVVTTQRGSTSDLQRRLGMGYAKAGRVMDQLQAAGIVGPQEGSKPRQVLVQDLNELHKIMDAYMK